MSNFESPITCSLVTLARSASRRPPTSPLYSAWLHVAMPNGRVTVPTSNVAPNPPMYSTAPPPALPGLPLEPPSNITVAVSPPPPGCASSSGGHCMFTFSAAAGSLALLPVLLLLLLLPTLLTAPAEPVWVGEGGGDGVLPSLAASINDVAADAPATVAAAAAAAAAAADAVCMPSVYNRARLATGALVKMELLPWPPLLHVRFTPTAVDITPPLRLPLGTVKSGAAPPAAAQAAACPFPLP